MSDHTTTNLTVETLREAMRSIAALREAVIAGAPWRALVGKARLQCSAYIRDGEIVVLPPSAFTDQQHLVVLSEATSAELQRLWPELNQHDMAAVLAHWSLQRERGRPLLVGLRGGAS